MLPEFGCLTRDVPKSKVLISVLYSLHIQAHRRHRFLVGVVLQLEQNRALACVVETQKQNLLVLITLVCLLHFLKLAEIAAHFNNY